MFSPKERNLVRQLRDLLDLYDRSPAMRGTVLQNLGDLLEQLGDAHLEAHAEHVSEVKERSDRQMEGLVALQTERERITLTEYRQAIATVACEADIAAQDLPDGAADALDAEIEAAHNTILAYEAQQRGES
jgi:hypothetical protein